VWLSGDAEKYVGEKERLLKGAKEEIYVIGGTVADILHHRDTIDKNDKRGVSTNLLVLDVAKHDVLKQYNDLIERKGHSNDLSHLERLNGMRNMKIVKFEQLPLAYFIARDMDEANGIIIVVHLLPLGPSYPSMTLTPSDGELYVFYKEQIKGLWAKHSQKCCATHNKRGI